jgi:hypothetical protein
VTAYAVPFYFEENAHLNAIAKTAAGVETVVTLTNHTGAGDPNGGTVRTAVAVPATSTLTIYREVPFTQTTSYAENDAFPAESHEKALDKLTTITQQLERRITNCIRGTEATPLSPLPSPTGTQQFVLSAAFNQPPSWQELPALAVGPITAAGSTQARFLSDRFADVVNVKDFGAVGDGVADDTTAFNEAINRIQANGGGELKVPKGTYKIASKINRTVSNIRIIGDGMPWYNGTNTALVGGTVIQGTVHLIGDNIAVQSLGIDCGVNVCDAINSGTPMDALVLMDPTRAIRDHCVVRDVTTLCKEPLSACHNFLLEGLSNSRFENLHAKFGQWGVVLKTQKSTADGITAYSCSQAGLAIKSDTGAFGSPCNNTTVSNVVVNNDEYTGAAHCILVYAATNDLYNFSLTNFSTKNGLVGLKLIGDTRSVYNNILSNVTISNGIIDYSGAFGFESFGAVLNVSVSSLAVRDTVSNKSIKVWDDCLGMILDNVFASALNTTDPLNIDLAGRFVFSNLVSVVGGDLNARSGINVKPEQRAFMSVGSYIGNLYTLGSSAAVTLVNGWTQYFSSVAIDARGNQAILRGRVQVPPTPWTGKEQIGTIQSNFAPLQTKWFMANAWNSSTSATVPVYIEISTSGSITATFLNTVAAFPSAILWVSLDGIQWSLNE